MMNGYGSHSVLTLDLHDYLSTLVYMKDEQYFNEEQLTRLSDRLEKPQVMGIHDKEFILPIIQHEFQQAEKHSPYSTPIVMMSNFPHLEEEAMLLKDWGNLAGIIELEFSEADIMSLLEDVFSDYLATTDKVMTDHEKHEEHAFFMKHHKAEFENYWEMRQALYGMLEKEGVPIVKVPLLASDNYSNIHKKIVRRKKKFSQILN